jgi:outer membrane protein
MKNIVKILALSLLCASVSMADFSRVELGTGIWSSEASGEVSYTASGATARDISSKNDAHNGYFWVLIKHPVPVIPNLRFEYANVNTKGIANGIFKNFTAANAPTELDLKQYDIIPYYNILDNTAWITLDLGLDIKLLDTSYTATGVSAVSSGGTIYSHAEMLPLPLFYARVRFEVPGTDLGLEGDAKFITYSSSTVYDARVKVDYTFDITPVIQPAIEVGYRVQKYDIDEADLDGKANLEFSGLYVGAMLRF